MTAPIPPRGAAILLRATGPCSAAVWCAAMTVTTPADIVVIDDHAEHLDYLATLLRRAGYVVAAFGGAEQALSFLKQCRPLLLVTDVFMPEKDGFEVLQEVRRWCPDLPLIAVSGVGPRSQSLFLDAMKHLGATAVFAKPIDSTALLATVAALVDGA
jgi:CheY-like chemotaxis protein